MTTLINPFQDFGLAGVLQPGANLGKIVYVNLGGSDANDGLGPSRPKLTIAGALDVCTNDAMDTIVVLDYWQNDSTYPISVDVSRVRIIGSPSGSYRNWPCITPTGNTAAMDIAANDVFVQNLYFEGGDDHGCIEFTTAGKCRIGIFDCWFASAKYGIWATGTSKPSFGLEVGRCFFCQNIVTNGILYDSNGPFAKFHHNIFEEIAGIGFYTQNAAAACMLLDNTFSLPSNTQGKAITLEGSTDRWIIAGNRANFGATTMGTNPYVDTSSGANHWMQNWKGTTETDPV